MKNLIFGCHAKETRFFIWHLDQKDQSLEKRFLRLALVEVMVMICFRQEGAIFIKKSPTYSKSPNVDAKYLACWRQ